VKPSHFIEAGIGQILRAMAPLLLDLAHLVLRELPAFEFA